ncbi:hypothetical protein [Micromonospora cathayae]|uniref:Uncharacterized protein n=1 Tax=Micromonospora cathayae TaxID=3028804 RepID=A0ABY7ZZ92_9ACTN|nr:hypothetical protein [Micromonospora sp. HUAS 3]WDZ87209.1 hypothetical protein PVK37_12775 [Micromonospora sp. HUAS 3]
MNGPSRFEITAEQTERNARGIAACRAVLEPVLARRGRPEPDAPLTPSEEIHQRALERAIGEKRGRRLVDLAAVGVVLATPPAPAREAPNRAAAEQDRAALDRLRRQTPAIHTRPTQEPR